MGPRGAAIALPAITVKAKMLKVFAMFIFCPLRKNGLIAARICNGRHHKFIFCVCLAGQLGVFIFFHMANGGTERGGFSRLVGANRQPEKPF